MNKKYILLFICFFITGLIIYFPGIQAPRYGDDFNIVPQGNLSYDLYKIWTSSYQREMFYRPLEDTITTFIIKIFGQNTLPVHILLLLLHTFVVWFTYYAMIKLKFDERAALFGAAFILVAQAQVFTVGSNDTLCMLLSSSFCLLSLWFFYRAFYENNNKVNIKFYLWSIVFFILDLLSKESGIIIIPFLFILIISQESIFSPRLFINLKQNIIRLLPYLALFAVYYIIHSLMVTKQPSLGDENYSFNIGLNIPKNIVMLLFLIFLPLSSVSTFEAVQLHDYKFLAAAAALAVILASLIVWGIWKSKKFKQSALLFSFVITGFFPFALMNHVNEQYIYISMPFIAMIIAAGMEYFTGHAKGILRAVVISVFIIFLLINMYSVTQKTGQITECGKRADMIFSQLNRYFPLIEPGGTLIFVNPPHMSLKYSVFVLPGFEGMKFADFYIYKLAGKSDFRIEVIDWINHEQRRHPGVLMLKLDGDKVVPLE